MYVDFTDLNKVCPKDPFPYTSDRPTSGCDCRPSLDELFRCLSGVPSNITSLGRLGKDNFCHSYWKLPLQGDTFWLEKCRVYLLKDDD